jgi:hypothetical protein
MVIVPPRRGVCARAGRVKDDAKGSAAVPAMNSRRRMANLPRLMAPIVAANQSINFL